MANRNDKRSKKAAKPIAMTCRNWAAVAAFQRSGAGKHADGRQHRNRTRGQAQRRAIADGW